jgi:hypothetical protein
LCGGKLGILTFLVSGLAIAIAEHSTDVFEIKPINTCFREKAKNFKLN